MHDIEAKIAVAQAIVATSDWPPDLFAAIYDVLAVDGIWQVGQQMFINATRNPLQISQDEAILRKDVLVDIGRQSSWVVTPTWKERALRALAAAISWVRSTPRSPVHQEHFPIELGGLARAIDSEATDFSLTRLCVLQDRFQIAFDQLRRSGTLSRSVEGRVLPAGARSEYGNSVKTFFANLIRIDSTISDSIDYAVVPTVRVGRLASELRVGFIPAVMYGHEVIWSKMKGCFHVTLNPRHERKVIDRVISALEWLVESEVDLVLMPELISTGKLRDAVDSWLRYQAPQQPILIVCGSEAVRSESATRRTNRAFVVGPYGVPLWHQDKHHQYKLSASQLRELALTKILGDSPINEIGTSTQTRMCIRDFPGVGRICVLVCEDFARAAPCHSIIESLGTDLNLVVVMDRNFGKLGWRRRNALDLAQDPGSCTAIANSRALLSWLPSKNDVSCAEDLAFFCVANQSVAKTTMRPGATAQTADAFLVEAGPKT